MPPTPLIRDSDNERGQSPARFGKECTLTPSRRLANLRGAILVWGLLATIICLTPPPTPAQNQETTEFPDVMIAQTHGHHVHSTDPDSPPTTRVNGPEPLSAKRMQSMMKANLEKSKKDSTELAALAKQLREELDKPDVNVLSLEVTNRLEKIEKLAKKIREETKGL